MSQVLLTETGILKQPFDYCLGFVHSWLDYCESLWRPKERVAAVSVDGAIERVIGVVCNSSACSR
jgi:hypothetical protein